MLESIVDGSMGRVDISEYDPLRLEDKRKLRVLLAMKERLSKRDNFEYQAQLLAQLSSHPKLPANGAQQFRESAGQASQLAYMVRFPWEKASQGTVDLETKFIENYGGPGDPRYEAANAQLERLENMSREERQNNLARLRKQRAKAEKKRRKLRK